MDYELVTGLRSVEGEKVKSPKPDLNEAKRSAMAVLRSLRTFAKYKGTVTPGESLGIDFAIAMIRSASLRDIAQAGESAAALNRSNRIMWMWESWKGVPDPAITRTLKRMEKQP